MPYISDAERERARWMTLAEAIARVEKHDDCDRRSALEQLCNAICDRKLLSKWEDRKWFDWQPERASFPARIRISDAKVADPDTGEWRTLLVLKDDVFRIWPGSSDASAGSKSGKAKAKGRGNPKAETEIYQAVDRLLKQGLNVIDMPWKDREALINAELRKRKSRKYSLRTLQTHFQSWQEKHRTDALAPTLKPGV